MRAKFVFGFLLTLTAFAASAKETNIPTQFTQGKVLSSMPSVLSQRDRIEPANKVVKYRLENLLPKLMDETDTDMWLVMNREYGEDALFYTLVPHTTFAARRTTLLVFVKNDDGEVERFTVSRYPIPGYYESKWDGGTKEQQWQRLAQIIEQYDPKNIAINRSKDWALADGLTVGMYETLQSVLSDKYKARLKSAENLVIRWLETRTEPELALYSHVVNIARTVIAEGFSNKVITPGATTTDDIAWYLRERFEELELRPWFQPYVNVQRQGDNYSSDEPFFGKYGRVIMPGDIIHTDVGICYLKLCTDTQEMAYVAKLGESEVPQGLVDAMAVGNHWQDLLTNEFVTGRTGNEILFATHKASKAAGIVSSTYTHPIGFVGHGIGPTIGMWDNQGETPIQGDWPLYPNTAYAIEGNIQTSLPEWDNELIQIKLEQTAVFDGETVWYLAGRQTEWHFIR